MSSLVFQDSLCLAMLQLRYLQLFLSVAMSSLFFLISCSVVVISLGSCPNSIAKSLKDLILVSLAYEEAFSNLYWAEILVNEFWN